MNVHDHPENELDFSVWAETASMLRDFQDLAGRGFDASTWPIWGGWTGR